jgi:hypothetical protein
MIFTAAKAAGVALAGPKTANSKVVLFEPLTFGGTPEYVGLMTQLTTSRVSHRG